MKSYSDNTEKKQARDGIVAVIKNVFKDKRLKMIELLGDGTGLAKYCEELNLDKMYAFESDKDRCGIVEEMQLECVGHNKYKLENDVYICTELLQYACLFLDDSEEKVDVLNLDLCTYFYTRGKIRWSPLEILTSLLEQEILADDSLIFLTTMIDGFQIDVSPIKSSVITEPAAIVNAVVEHSLGKGFILLPVDYIFIYKSDTNTRGSVMMLCCFQYKGKHST